MALVPCLVVLITQTAVAEDGRWQEAGETDCRLWLAAPRPAERVNWSGACADGKAEGLGIRILTYDKGGLRVAERYEGGMAAGKPHGHGTITFANNERYVGAWQNGKRSGQGTWYEADGSRLYQGEFKAGRWHGQGTVYFANGQPFYRGQFRDDRFHGQGTIVYANGARYEGQWRAGQRHGRGVRIRANSDRYEGPFVDNQAHGLGHCFEASSGREGRCEMRYGKFVRWLE